MTGNALDRSRENTIIDGESPPDEEVQHVSENLFPQLKRPFQTLEMMLRIISSTNLETDPSCKALLSLAISLRYVLERATERIFNALRAVYGDTMIKDFIPRRFTLSKTAQGGPIFQIPGFDVKADLVYYNEFYRAVAFLAYVRELYASLSGIDPVIGEEMKQILDGLPDLARFRNEKSPTIQMVLKNHLLSVDDESFFDCLAVREQVDKPVTVLESTVGEDTLRKGREDNRFPTYLQRLESLRAQALADIKFLETQLEVELDPFGNTICCVARHVAKAAETQANIKEHPLVVAPVDEVAVKAIAEAKAEAKVIAEKQAIKDKERRLQEAVDSENQLRSAIEKWILSVDMLFMSFETTHEPKGLFRKNNDGVADFYRKFKALGKLNDIISHHQKSSINDERLTRAVKLRENRAKWASHIDSMVTTFFASYRGAILNMKRNSLSAQFIVEYKQSASEFISKLRGNLK